ncbi:Alpha-L-rhamnosidase [Fusarium falciforme]|uniref:Alpha-L-rhamnosidase n=1 Tax=Fusarium falciforme TaxID=195108 RepID=UPI002301B8E3|nr:Alpha-L-rhamnosidase [Fusarium falciforme]WAO96867.1 Alpha-L-rhamnosidase [Fusarium falciforme]
MAETTDLQVFPGATWTASNGRHIQAHGGGFLKVGATWYWHGEDKTQGTCFQNINCYSSNDLAQWKYEGPVLSRQGSGDLGPGRLVERPKVIYNKLTNKYVMWMHIEDQEYKDAKVGVAVCDTVTGRFQYRGSLRPLGFESRDIGVFVDDDDKAYLMSEDRPNGLRIYELSNDYLSVTKMLHLFPEHLESPATIKRNGIYYLLASQLTGWELNDNMYTTSTSLTGPWEPWKLFAEAGTATYGSQVTFILNLGSSVLYMGDRWEHPPLPRSTYVWLPLNISGRTVTLENIDSFVLDARAGGTRDAIPFTMYKPDNENAATASKVTFESRETVSRLTLAIQYTSSFEKEQNLVVAVDGLTCKLAFLPSATPDTLAVTTLHMRGEIPPGQHCFEVVDQGFEPSGLSIRGLVVPNV